MTNAQRDILIGGGALALALLGWFVVIPIGVDVPGSVKIMALSPDFWPRIIMGMLAACGVIVLVQGLAARGRGTPAADHPPPETSDDTAPVESDATVHFSTAGQVLRIVTAFACLFAFYLLSPVLGVVAGCMILALAATRVLGVRSWAKSAGLAVILPVLLYFFFTQVAHIPIPLGVFEALR